MIGGVIKLFAVWSACLLLLYGLVGHRWLQSQEDAAQAPTAAASPAAARTSDAQGSRNSSPNTLVYRADKRGHVLLDGAINGAPVRLMVDTGASFVALTMQDAMAAGISRSSLVFNKPISTANGTTRVAEVRLREVRLGQFSVYDVPAVVHENLNISLLGQTFLKRLDSYEMRDGVLTLFWN